MQSTVEQCNLFPSMRQVFNENQSHYINRIYSYKPCKYKITILIRVQAYLETHSHLIDINFCKIFFNRVL